MYYEHFETIDSTQSYLKKHITALLSKDKNILISTSGQNSGVGRQGNSWVQFQNSIAFSFTLTPQKNIPLTSLELAVLIALYFKETQNITMKLKWPNDLFNEELLKCGGIICNYHTKNTIIVGVGINLTSPKEIATYKFNPGFISEKLLPENLPKDIYRYILKNRLTAEKIKRIWTKQCFHIDSQITLFQGNNKNLIKGMFIGIGENGEAIIKKDDSEQISIMSGNLKIDSLPIF